ncbi:calphotin isoform X1 [Drosophila kikkawai]|uniref:Calphotin isoform X1 n=1 Tax=Drosophila kikkawai TaxID=30033 RepID=A0ABM3C7S5_DROKI
MKTTIVEERSVNETIETIATSSGTIQETIEVVNINEGSPAPKQRHHHHHHRHHHHHQRQENVEVVETEEVIVLDTEPKPRSKHHHHHHHKQKASPPPPLPETSPPFLTPTDEEDEVDFNVVWKPQAFWTQPSPNPSTDLDLSVEKEAEEILDTTSASDEFTTVVWQTETKETTRESLKHTRVVQEEIIVDQVDPPAYAPPQLKVQTGFFPSGAQQPSSLSPIAEVVQTDVIVGSEDPAPFSYIPRVNLVPTETVVETVTVVAAPAPTPAPVAAIVPAQIEQEPEFIPQPGFVARIIENIEVAAASQALQAPAPAPKVFYPRSGGLVEPMDVVVESVTETIDADSPFLLPTNGFDSEEETIVETVDVTTEADSPFLLPANGFDSESIVENIEITQPEPVVQIPVQSAVPKADFVESIVENIEVQEVDPPFLLPVQTGFNPQPGNVESIIENIEITTEVEPPLRPLGQSEYLPRSGFVESIVETIEVAPVVEPPQPVVPVQSGLVESIVETIEVTEEVSPPVTPSIEIDIPTRAGLVETIVENIQTTEEDDPPVRPPLPIGFPPRSGYVESIVEDIEVAEVSPNIPPPVKIDIIPQAGFVESIVENIEIEKEPEIVEEVEVIQDPPLRSVVTTNIMPRSSMVQELVVESLEVTPTSSPPPEQFPFISRESLIEADNYVEVEEVNSYYTAQQSPEVEVKSLSEAEAYVEIVEVTPINTPPRSPSLEEPVAVGFVPRPSLAETAVIVESLDVTPTPSPPPTPPLKLRLPPPNQPQQEIIVESVDVTPTPSPPPANPQPKAKPLNSFILTDLVIDDPPVVEVVEREILVESSPNGNVTEVIEITEEIVEPPTPIGTVLVGEISEQSNDKFGKRYSLSAALTQENNPQKQQEQPTETPMQKRDIAAEPPKRKCCPCKCTIS